MTYTVGCTMKEKSNSLSRTVKKTCSTCDNAETRSWQYPCKACLPDLKKTTIEDWVPEAWVPRNNSSEETVIK